MQLPDVARAWESHEICPWSCQAAYKTQSVPADIRRQSKSKIMSLRQKSCEGRPSQIVIADTSSEQQKSTGVMQQETESLQNT